MRLAVGVGSDRGVSTERSCCMMRQQRPGIKGGSIFVFSMSVLTYYASHRAFFYGRVWLCAVASYLHCGFRHIRRNTVAYAGAQLQTGVLRTRGTVTSCCS